MKAFITGSRAYGKPTDKSDIDLVVMVSEEVRATLYGLCDEGPTKMTVRAASSEIINKGPIRFGKLNLIVCTSEKEYATWKHITDVLYTKSKMNGPVSREEAKGVFTAGYEAVGLVKGEPS